ncbi:MAG: hypothetical protein IIA63_07855 [Nitrospinae bacterium]|nr:hypothetical protein [Nitrospinota bacterium]
MVLEIPFEQLNKSYKEDKGEIIPQGISGKIKITLTPWNLAGGEPEPKENKPPSTGKKKPRKKTPK